MKNRNIEWKEEKMLIYKSIDLFLTRHSGTLCRAGAYQWSIDQATAWNMIALANYCKGFVKKYYDGYQPYPYERPIRTNKPF